MLYGWQEAAIRGFAPAGERPALLAALRRDQEAAERALTAKHRRQREEQAEAARKRRAEHLGRLRQSQWPKRPRRSPSRPDSGPRR